MGGQPAPPVAAQPPTPPTSAAAAAAAAAQIATALQAVSAAAAATPVSNNGSGDQTHIDDGMAVHAAPSASDDSMGGGATDGVSNKRTIDAVNAAKGIAARAKAKAAPSA